MQELLARLKALDPNASLALRIIGCFDELVRGGVNIQGLLGAARACIQPQARDERLGYFEIDEGDAAGGGVSLFALSFAPP